MKERAKAGIWFSIKRSLLRSKIKKIEKEEIRNQLIYRTLKINERTWKIMTTYLRDERKENSDRIREAVGEKPEDIIII